MKLIAVLLSMLFFSGFNLVSGFIVDSNAQKFSLSENVRSSCRYSTSPANMIKEQNSSKKSRVNSIMMGTETLIIPMMDDTRVKVRFDPSQFQELATKTNNLISSFKALQTAEKMGKVGHKEDEMDYRFESENGGELTKLEIECNPNIYPDALHAKLFIKISTNTVEITSECMVTALIDSLKSYKATYNLKLENSN